LISLNFIADNCVQSYQKLVLRSIAGALAVGALGGLW